MGSTTIDITRNTGRASSTADRALRRRRRRIVAALVVVGAVTVSACGSDDDSTDSASPVPAVEEFSGDEVIAGGDSQGAAEDDAAETSPETGGVASPGLPISLEDRDIITSVGLTMSTSDVRRTTDDIRRITAASGGIVFSSDVFLDDAAEDGSVPGGGQIVIKVATGDLDQLVTDLDGVGVVTRLSQDADDVTDQLVDLDIRIRQAESGIARIELLLADAVDLDDVFAIENELNRRQVELEQLRAAERSTDDLVALATLTVQIEYRTPDALLDIAEPGDGIGDAFADGWGAFVGAVFAIGYVVAVGSPFLLTVALVVALAWLLGRRWNRGRAAVREQRRLDADLRGDSFGGPLPTAYPSSAPPPVAAQRIPDETVAGTEAESAGDTMVDAHAAASDDVSDDASDDASDDVSDDASHDVAG